SNEEDIQRIAAIIRVRVLAKSGLNIGKLTALKYSTFTEKVLTFLELYLEDSRLRISSLKSLIMLALLDTSAETNILTTSTACDLNLECRPI
ncbi:hypothetical protein L249_3140, partial [Ophiocordyceps polyrhachis-furcata BCC 54312]